MVNYLDDFVCNIQSDEYAKYSYDYEMHDAWYEIESDFCEEMDLEPEVYED